MHTTLGYIHIIVFIFESERFIYRYYNNNSISKNELRISRAWERVHSIRRRRRKKIVECLHEIVHKEKRRRRGIGNKTKHTLFGAPYIIWLLTLFLSPPFAGSFGYLLALFRFAYKFHNWSKLTCSSFFSRSLMRILSSSHLNVHKHFLFSRHTF